MKKGRVGVVVAMMHKPHRDHHFSSYFRRVSTSRRWPFNVLVDMPTHFFVREFQQYSTLRGQITVEEVCYISTSPCERCSYSMCHSFVKCLTENQPQSNKCPKSRIKTKKGSDPLHVQNNAFKAVESLSTVCLIVLVEFTL